jgi:hypothetical protein
LFNGREFWQSLTAEFGAKIVAGFKLAMYPVVLCPAFMDPSTIRGNK